MYAVGDVAVLTPRMKGWRIEVPNDAQEIEGAVIKRIDADINCALVAFDSGRKEWLDLSLSAFKVVAEPSLSLATDHDDVEEQQQTHESDRQPPHDQALGNGGVDNERDTIEQLDENHTSKHHVVIPPLVAPALFVDTSSKAPLDDAVTASAAQFRSKALPDSDVTSFDWYADGGHVEICDAHGSFIEGAILCAKTDTHVHLYNETHQFFEIAMAMQPFKVVIHGLLSLKAIPVGQAIEVYSAMTGSFHAGTVIKSAEVGKLTPVRFASGAVEWLDLSTQTFKLVFLSDVARQVSSGEPQKDPPLPSPSLVEQVPSQDHSLASSPAHKHHSHHHHHHKPPHHGHAAVATSPPLTLPTLAVGQRIEIFEAASKQFAKYRVTGVHDTRESHSYEVEPQTRTLNGASLAFVKVPSLANLRCRIPLEPHMWSEHASILPGHRVDVYDRVEKTVASGKIVQVGGENEHGLLVRYKDGARRWIQSQHVKVKLRLNGEPLDVHDIAQREDATSEAIPTEDLRPTEATSNGATTDEMWERQPRPSSLDDNDLHEPQPDATRAKTRLSRHFSNPASLLSPSTTTTTAGSSTLELPLMLGHCASTGDLLRQRSLAIDSMRMTQRIPSVVQPLDFSSLRKLEAIAAATSSPMFVDTEHDRDSNDSDLTHSSSRSKDLDAALHSSHGVPFTLDDVWREARDGGAVEYIHVASGLRQSRTPEWLERVDASTGALYVVHTPTSTLFSMPTALAAGNASTSVSSSRANSSASGSVTASPGDSGGRNSVPVGPLEAVRELRADVRLE